jgi:hypothetical protein
MPAVINRILIRDTDQICIALFYIAIILHLSAKIVATITVARTPQTAYSIFGFKGYDSKLLRTTYRADSDDCIADYSITNLYRSMRIFCRSATRIISFEENE